MNRIIDLVLYGHFWIALAALAMAQQSYLLLGGDAGLTPYSGWLFCGTLCLYAVHRLVGLQRLPDDQDPGRFRAIRRLRRWIAALAVLSALAAGYFFLQFPLAWWKWLAIPALLSIGYVIPLPGGKRLRDIHYIKIFLIAVVWAWLVVLLPALDLGLLSTLPPWLLAAEKLTFIFAITLPFDIRDLRIDRAAQVHTLPATLGPAGARRLAWGLLLVSLLIAALGLYLYIYSLQQCLAVAGSLLVAALLIQRAGPEKHDYFFTGWLDGCMHLQFLLVILAS